MILPKSSLLVSRHDYKYGSLTARPGHTGACETPVGPFPKSGIQGDSGDNKPALVDLDG